jgi:olefin beta-lactone synthetase
MNIVNLFWQTATTQPNLIAIIEKDRTITFGQLQREIQETVQYFIAQGVKPGDRVLVFVPMGFDLYRIVLALFYMGATAVFLDEWVNKSRMEICCQVASCQVFIAGWKVRLLAYLSKELRKIPIWLGTDFSTVGGEKQAMFQPQGDHTALITFTTGSTGRPKAAKRTHGFLYEQFLALSEKIEPQPTDIDMPALPIVLLINLGAGCTSIIPDFKATKPNELDPAKIYKQLTDHKANRLIASPFFVKKLAQYLIQTNQSLPLIQKVFTGGAPVFATEAAIYHQAFPVAAVEIVYGSTEAEPISGIPAEALLPVQKGVLTLGLPVGKPFYKTQVRILGITDQPIACRELADLDTLTLADGEIGEITVSGSHVLREYVDDEAALRHNKIFVGPDCWHRTGDSGFLKDGKLYLTGRCNTLIYRGKHLIAPFVFEGYFQTFAGVEIGTIMEIDGQIIAWLEASDQADKTSIEAQVLAAEPAINCIIFVQMIPRDLRHNTKIDYEKLKKLVQHSE